MSVLACLAVVMALSLLMVPLAQAAITWTPLITAADFTGPTADIQTAATGIITILIVIACIGLLARIFSR